MKEGPEARLLQRARSPEDAEALQRFDSQISLPLVLAAVLPLVILPSGQHTVLAISVNVAAWLVFVVDFVVHERRLRGFLRTWVGRFDLAVVVITAPWFLIASPNQTKFVLAIRLARLLRLIFVSGAARRLLDRLGRVAVVAGGVVFVASAIAYQAEHPTNPEFKTYGDALWWGVVTLTTVGYGDIVPKTSTGRFAGLVIMFTGIAVLGVLAGSLASFFRLNRPPAGDAGDASAADPETTLATEVAELREQIARLTDQVSRLTSVPSPPGTAPGPPPRE